LYCLERQIEEHAYAFNRDAYRVLQAFLEHVEKFKAARRQFDFVDAEWRVLQLLRDEAAAAFLQVRLDARYSHVLLDEFQDTNPLQWQILLAWLGAYSDAARPGVFMVGDPKQSIYRFRRAEPRLFAAAASFLESHFAAARCSLDITRRNAQPIIDVVNALFLGVPEFEPFREQQSLVGSVPGRVELIPLCEDQETGERSGQSCDGLRDPLTEAASEVVDLRRFKEAAGVAERIQQMVGSWEIEDIDASGTAKSRPMRYGDIMLLTRSRTKLAEYEKALVAADIPFDAASRGGLLATLEARDMAALLEFLVSPVADLQLAQALRSPIFACTDEDLLCLAARKEATWWLRLQALVESNAGDGRDAAEVATPRLRRAASLLGDWLKAADRLPAHDLVDRIFHQGEVLARYRLAVPPAVRAGVEASLQALLLLSLDLDGGRYPSLPRFIDELRELQAADAGDAPDEGAIESAVAVSASESGRVRILTIHGAKGLESPLVWLLDANAAPRAAETWDVLVDWPPQSVSPQHFSFYGRADGRGKARQPLFENQSAAAAREELNLLYVAITRARQVFIASGIAGTPGGAETPYRRLQSALEKLGGSGCRLHGVGLPQANGDGVVAAVAAKLNEPVVEVLPLPRLGERRRVPDAGERFGILLHASLERRTGKSARDGWWRDSGFDDAEYKQVMPVAERLLATPALQRFFDSACYRRAWNELDVSGSDGALRRIDRLVEFDDALWVLDYKSSGMATPRIDAYKAQVADYCAAVAAVFSERPVRGALVFSDASLIEVH
jgi:ATP-dependent helicase/nuclease subunit A